MNKKQLPAFAFVLFVIAIVAFTSSHSKNYPEKNSVDTLPLLSIKAKDHLGKSITSSNGAISFTTGLENDFYYVDSVNKVSHFYIEARLSKFVNDNVKRIPLNISIVIDRSGSMQGIKMGFAKKAAKNIIDQLQPVDYVSVVMYDNAIDSV